MAAFAQIISVTMNYNSPPQNTFRADKLDLPVRDGTLGVPLCIGFEVAKVSNMAIVIGGRTVFFTKRID